MGHKYVINPHFRIKNNPSMKTLFSMNSYFSSDLPLGYTPLKRSSKAMEQFPEPAEYYFSSLFIYIMASLRNA